MPTETIALLLDGAPLAGWSEYDIDLDFFAPSASWRVAVAGPKAGDLARIRHGAVVSLLIGDAVLMRGWLETAQWHVSAGSGTGMVLSGRDYLSVLEGSALQSPIEAATVKQALERLLARFRLSNAGPELDATARSAAWSIAWRPDETAWSWLQRGVRAAGLSCWTEAGKLHVAKPETSAAVAELRYGDSGANVLEVSWSRDLTLRSPLLVQARGRTRAIAATVADPELDAAGVYRPDIIQADDHPSHLSARAVGERELARRRKAAEVLEVTVAGHGYASAKPWRLNSFVRWAGAGPAPGNWWIGGIHLTRSSAGTTTTLRLTREAPE